MQPADLHLFATVAELHSFTAAAERLGQTRAAASAAVARLEASLGTRLLQRTTRRVTLTPDGQAFLDRARDLLADLDELGSLFRQQPGSLRGRLRVDLPLLVVRDRVVPALPGFLRQHPGLQLEISSSDRRVDLVREGFDCVLRVGRLADSHLIARPLGTLPMANCASPAYLAAHGTPQTLADLARHQLVHYAPTLGGTPDGFETTGPDGAVHTTTMAGALTVASTDAYHQACVAGLGLIQVPRQGVLPLLQAGQLVEVMTAWPAPAMPVHLLYASRRQLPRRVQAFMDWLAATLAPMFDEGREPLALPGPGPAAPLS